MTISSTASCLSFGPEYRLRSKKDLQHTQDNGKKLYSKHFLIIASKTENPVSRLGVTITKKVDPRSVVRNRLRRRIREVFRLNRHQLAASLDVLIIARNSSPECSSEQIRKEVMGALFHGNYLLKTS